MTINLTYDGDEGHNWEEHALISCPREDPFCKATAKALGWTTPPEGDASDDRLVVPAAKLENLFRYANVNDPEAWKQPAQPVPLFVQSCLHKDWLSHNIDKLVEDGLLERADGDDDDDEPRIFTDINELQERCDEIVKAGDYVVEDDSLDTYEALTNSSGVGDWLPLVTMYDLVITSRNLTAYCALSLAVGPRDVDRLRPSAQLKLAAVSPTGGLIMDAVKIWHVGREASAVPPTQLVRHLPAFFEETEWPFPYAIEFDDTMDYLLDLPKRIQWQSATGSLWQVLVKGRLGIAVSRLSPLDALMEDHRRKPSLLVRDVQRVGHALLPGDGADKLVLWRISELNEKLRTEWSDYIYEKQAASEDTTAIVNKLVEAPEGRGGRGTGDGSIEREITGATEAGGMVAPKQKQMERALRAESYLRLEHEFLDPLRTKGQPQKDVLRMLAKCFKETTVLPKAVLFGTQGMRLSIYTSDFLDLVRDERESLGLYIGQSLAWDDDEKCVPEELTTFTYDADQLKLFTSFKWDEMDPLNSCILKLRAEETGARFNEHDKGEVYHDGDMIALVSELYGRLFQSIGYPEKVDSAEGLTFEDFMRKIKKLYTKSMGLDEQEAANLFKLIDQYVGQAFTAAAANARKIIYGASPADRELRAWLPASTPMLRNLTQTLTQMKSIASMRRALPDVFNKQPTARTLRGFHSVGAGGAGAGGGGGDRMKDIEGGGVSKRKTAAQKKAEKKAVKEVAKEGKKKTGGKVHTKADVIKANGIHTRCFHFTGGDFSIGSRLYKWNKICKHLKWDPSKVCGPFVMAYKDGQYVCTNADHR